MSTYKSIYNPPHPQLILDFLTTNVEGFNSNLGYRKWHYEKDFVKNCEYGTDQYKYNVACMQHLNKVLLNFLCKQFKDFKIKEAEDKRIDLSDKPTIFLYWHQGKDKLPTLQQFCYDRLLNKCSKDFNILMLEHSNIKDYIDIPDYIEQAMLDDRIWLQNYVDYIRLKLLSKYSGIWLDATIFVKDNLSNVNFNYPFWSIKCRNMFSNTWATNVMPEMNNCQIYAMGGTSNKFFTAMSQIFEYYLQHFDVAFSYFMPYYFAQYLYQTDEEIKYQFDILDYNNEDVEMLVNFRKESSNDLLKRLQENKDTHLYKLLKFAEESILDDGYKVYLLLQDYRG